MTIRDWVELLVYIDYVLMWLIWLWLTWQLLRKMFSRFIKALDEAVDASAEADERRDIGLQVRVEKVRQIARDDPELLATVASLAGIDHIDLQQGFDADLIRRIAKDVSDTTVDVIGVAASQQDFRFAVDEVTDREPVGYPTSDIEPVPMTDYGQITEIGPEDLLLPPDQFAARLALNEMTILQSYEEASAHGRIYVLEDVSMSMDARMSNGLARYVWAHGISASLAMAAMRGGGEFCRREFDGRPLELIEVQTPEDARVLLSRILGSGTTGGGTAIYNALRQAIDDIRERGAADLGDNILLITDGEDDKLPSAARLREELGDIKLHVAQIGNSTRKLRSVATTYRSFK